MSVRLLFQISFLLFTTCVTAQQVWTEINPFEGGLGLTINSLTIDNRPIVVVQEVNGQGSAGVWEYFQNSDSWERLGTLPFELEQVRSVQFSGNDELYSITSPVGNGEMSELFRFDINQKVWSTSLLSNVLARDDNNFFAASSFRLDDEVFIATSAGETWAFNIENESLTQRASSPNVTPRNIGFSIQGFGYVMYPNATDEAEADELWRYTADIDTWERISFFPDGRRQSSVSFVIDNRVYIGLGDGDIETGIFHFYDPDLDQWGVISPEFPRESLTTSFGFAVNDLAYVGVGEHYILDGDYTSQVWRLDSRLLNVSNRQIQEISAYPNPVKERLYISAFGEINALRIFDIQGKRVDFNQSTKNEIDVSSLEAGIYFLRVESGGLIYSKRFIKN